MVVVPFGDLDGGRFWASVLMLEGRVTEPKLLDGDGDEIVKSDVLDLDSMNWDLDDYVGGVGFIGETMSPSVNAYWELFSNNPAAGDPGLQDSSRATANRASLVLVVALGVLPMLWYFLLL